MIAMSQAKRLFNQHRFGLIQGRHALLIEEAQYDGALGWITIEAGDIDRDETPPALTYLVNRLCQQLLSRSGLTGNQHRFAGKGDGLEILHEGDQGRILSLDLETLRH